MHFSLYTVSVVAAHVLSVAAAPADANVPRGASLSRPPITLPIQPPLTARGIVASDFFSTTSEAPSSGPSSVPGEGINTGMGRPTYVNIHPNGDQAYCLDVQGGNFADGTPVQVYGCNGSSAQKVRPFA